METYLTVRFQADTQRSFYLQMKIPFDLAVTVGRLASVAARIVGANLMQPDPVSSGRYPPSIGH